MPIKSSEGLRPGSLNYRTFQFIKARPKTTRQLARLLGLKAKRVATIVNQLRKAKLIHCCDYTAHVDGDHHGPQMIYMVGWDKEPPHPPLVTPKGSQRKYSERLKAPKPATSVFDLAYR